VLEFDPAANYKIPCFACEKMLVLQNKVELNSRIVNSQALKRGERVYYIGEGGGRKE
jgi:hypothetical protein